jgi:uncharacterized RDD family membrane protein YckC
MSAPPPLPPAPVLPREWYTPWVTRLAALLIDIVPAVVIFGIGGVIVEFADHCSLVDPSATGYGYCGWAINGDFLLGLAFMAALACFGLALAYVLWNFGYRQGKTGSSLGKSVLRFVVVNDRTGQPIGFGQSIARLLVHVFLDTACYIGFLWPLWDARRQTFADKIVGTVCVPRA